MVVAVWQKENPADDPLDEAPDDSWFRAMLWEGVNSLLGYVVGGCDSQINLCERTGVPKANKTLSVLD